MKLVTYTFQSKINTEVSGSRIFIENQIMSQDVKALEYAKKNMPMYFTGGFDLISIVED